jgi:hypothetical protein
MRSECHDCRSEADRRPKASATRSRAARPAVARGPASRPMRHPVAPVPLDGAPRRSPIRQIVVGSRPAQRAASTAEGERNASLMTSACPLDVHLVEDAVELRAHGLPRRSMGAGDIVEPAAGEQAVDHPALRRREAVGDADRIGVRRRRRTGVDDHQDEHAAAEEHLGGCPARTEQDHLQRTRPVPPHNACGPHCGGPRAEQLRNGVVADGIGHAQTPRGVEAEPVAVVEQRLRRRVGVRDPAVSAEMEHAHPERIDETAVQGRRAADGAATGELEGPTKVRPQLGHDARHGLVQLERGIGVQHAQHEAPPAFGVKRHAVAGLNALRPEEPRVELGAQERLSFEHRIRPLDDAYRPLPNAPHPWIELRIMRTVGAEELALHAGAQQQLSATAIQVMDEQRRLAVRQAAHEQGQEIVPRGLPEEGSVNRVDEAVRPRLKFATRPPPSVHA